MIYLIIIILGLVIDRLTKIYAVNNLMEKNIDGKLFNLTYLENRGRLLESYKISEWYL